MRPLPNSFLLGTEASTVWVASDLKGDANLPLLADPDRLFASSECETIKDQRKIKVGRIALKLRGRIQGVYLKRYNPYCWRYRVGSLFFPSAAVRSWLGAHALLRAGFHTGRPIAAVESRAWGMLAKSFYLSEEVAGKTADAYWLEKLSPACGEGRVDRRRFLQELAGLFRSLHGLGLYHNDLKDANILVCSEQGKLSFNLLDLEGIRRYGRLSERRKVKNLVQLNRTMGRYLTRSQKLHWLRAYLGDAFSDRKEKRRWIERILKESRRRDLRSLRKG